MGLHASYISAQLGAFRYGTRTAASPDCMQYVAAGLTESGVTAVAAWLASLPIPADPSPVPKGTLPMPLVCGAQGRAAAQLAAGLLALSRPQIDRDGTRHSPP